MSWIGVFGVLVGIITVVFFNFDFFSRTMFWFPRSSQAEREKRTDAEHKTSEVRAQQEIKEPTTLSSETDSTQTTPKASASNPVVSVLQVPELSLNETDKMESSDRTRRDNDSPVAQNKNVTSSSTLSTPSTNSLSSQQRRPPTLKPISAPSNQQFLLPPRPKPSTSLRPPPSAAASLRNPAGDGLSTSTLAPAQRSTRKVILEPGHSPLDWASLTKDPQNNLRGAGLPPNLIKVTPSMLKAHNGRKGTDAWTSYNGKVYNITPFVPFHPGGRGQLLRGAGRDSVKLFLEIHPWVNWDGFLGECLVGILVSESQSVDQENELDAMD